MNEKSQRIFLESRVFLENRAWADEMKSRNPEYFHRMLPIQKPDILWIGCSDSRVPAELIVNAAPGEIFIHRNIANLVDLGDPNTMSVVQYGIQALGIDNIVVCGHHGCGGVMASMHKPDPDLNFVNQRLEPLRALYAQHREEIESLVDSNERVSSEQVSSEQVNKLVDLNVIDQVDRIVGSPLLQQMWNAGRKITVHGWVYSMKDGLLRQLKCISDAQNQTQSDYLDQGSA
jgi:carbonic anhydrase